MKLSTDRILTTHTGSLPRPKSLIDLVLRKERGEAIDAAAFEAQTAKAVDDIVAEQVAAGVDIVSDGEMSKPSYTTYIRHRVEGIEPDPRAAETGPRHHDRPRPAGASGFRQPPAEFFRLAVSRLRRRVALQGPRPAAARPDASRRRGRQGEAGRRVHDRTVARHPDALHHQPALSERGRLRGRARRRAQGRVPGDRQRRFRVADRLPGLGLLPQQPVPRPERRPVPQDRRSQHRGAQRCNGRTACRQNAAAHLLGQLRRAPTGPRRATPSRSRPTPSSSRRSARPRRAASSSPAPTRPSAAATT